jgi:hypothetical protein
MNASSSFFGEAVAAARFPAVGTTVSGTIAAEPRIAQQTEFQTGKPLVWADGTPREQLLVDLQTPTGLVRVYVKGSLKTAIGQALRASGQSALVVGQTLSITYTGDAAPKAPGLHGAKMYTATVTAGAPVAAAAPAAPPVVAAPVPVGLPPGYAVAL